MSKRLIKWIGDPPVLKADGSVYNWRYENARMIPIAGKSWRVIATFDRVRLPNGQFKDIPNGLSRAYEWDQSNLSMTIEVEAEDWEIIHKRQPHEFRDVTGLSDEAIANVHQEAIYKGIVVPTRPIRTYSETGAPQPIVNGRTMLQYERVKYEYNAVDVPPATHVYKPSPLPTEIVDPSDFNRRTGT
jgi:hypothetical protein